MFNKTRSKGYRVLSFLNDVNAIAKGKFLKRQANKVMGKNLFSKMNFKGKKK